MTVNIRSQELLREKADNKSVIFRLPNTLLAALTSYQSLYNDENGIDVSLNKIVVSIRSNALKADVAKRKRRKAID